MHPLSLETGNRTIYIHSNPEKIFNKILKGNLWIRKQKQWGWIKPEPESLRGPTRLINRSGKTKRGFIQLPDTRAGSSLQILQIVKG